MKFANHLFHLLLRDISLSTDIYSSVILIFILSLFLILLLLKSI